MTVTGSTTILLTTTSLTTVTSTTVETETTTTTTLSVSTAPTETSTQDVTFTTQLPAKTSYTTITIGTQTVVSTLSVATVTSTLPPSTATTTLPASTVTSTLPASTQVVTTTVSRTASTVTSTLAASTSLVTVRTASQGIPFERSDSGTIGHFDATSRNQYDDFGRLNYYSDYQPPGDDGDFYAGGFDDHGHCYGNKQCLHHCYHNHYAAPSNADSHCHQHCHSFLLHDWDHDYDIDGHEHACPAPCVHRHGHYDGDGDGDCYKQRRYYDDGHTRGIDIDSHGHGDRNDDSRYYYDGHCDPRGVHFDFDSYSYYDWKHVTSTPAASTATQSVTVTATTDIFTTDTVTTTQVNTVTQTTVSVSVSTTTAPVSACTPSSYSTAIATACATPTGSFKIGIQNFGGACMSSQYGGAVPNRDHNSLVLSTLSSNCTTFGAVSNGQTTEITSNGLTLYSDQNSQYGGNGAVHFDSLNSIQNQQYQTYSEAVQFCLQPDNTFIVQNPSVGANVLQLCNDVLYLYTPGNATNSGCTSVTLIRGVGAAPPSY
ncbi:hypothetical protein LTR53_016449 [Teratosphaeriaceae sp. CCFEE 6253]|nr:hypothetical protein LTR53_016449 [Teratosphaeriaceae sp. CCFEE 6253]